MTSTNLTDWVTPYLKKNPPIKFYDVPEHRLAAFSTKRGTIPKRQLSVPPSPAILRSGVAEEIQRMAKRLRGEFPDIVRAISRPLTSWFELYDYFDGVDLWQEGASFLFYVLNHISNENLELNHELEGSKHVEICDWAKLWIQANIPRVLSVPASQDLISIFDESERKSINGLDHKYIVVLGNALTFFRKDLDHLLPPVDEVRRQFAPQSIQHIRQPVQPHTFHQDQHRQLQHGQHMMSQGPPIIQHGQPIVSHPPYPMFVDEPQRNQMMPMQPMPPMHPHHHTSQQHVPYDTFMEQQRSIAPFNSMPPQGPGDFRQGVHQQWERRQRGYSIETGRGGRGGRGNGHNNNFGPQNRNFPQVDRRMVAKNATPRGSPLRHVSQLTRANEGPGPVYVHHSQRQSPTFDGDSTPRASDRGMQQTNQRIVSEQSSGRSGYSNDARLWQANDRQRANSKPREITNDSLPSPPFEHHPQAWIIARPPPQKSSSTFWCIGQPQKPYDDQGPRTVYVTNVERDDFESRALERIAAKFGQVESISYVYAPYPRGHGGPAFVAFLDESSVETAIRGLDGFEIRPGVKLAARIPASRSRSGSYSSQNTYEHSYIPRDFQYRVNNRRGSIRNQSISYRAPSYAGTTDDHVQASSKSLDGPSPSRAPLTEGFQAQLQPTQSFPMHSLAEPLASTFAEMLQHNAAMDRYPIPNQMPLGNIENYHGTRGKDNNRPHRTNFSVNQDNGGEPTRTVMSQGSYNRKENSPKKKDSTKNTPFPSPKKDSSHPEAGDNSQKGNGGKNKKKANKQNSSTRPSRVPSPAKSSIEDMIFGVLADEQKADDRSATDTPKPNTSAPSVIEAAESKVPEFEVGCPNAVENKKPPIVDAKALGLGEYLTSTRHESHIPSSPLVMTQAIVEQQVTPSSKSEVTQIIRQSSCASEDETKPLAQKGPTQPTASPSEIHKTTLGLEGEPKPQKTKSKKKKRKPIPKSDPEQSNTSLASKDSSETLKSSFMTENTENFVTALSSPNPSLTSGSSEICLCAADSANSSLDADATITSPIADKHQMEIKHSKTDTNASTGSTPTPKSAVKSGKKSREAHSKKGSEDSSASTGSVRKTDIKLTKPGDKTDENAKPDAGDNLRESQKENYTSLPAVNLDDSTQWPSLGTPKTPLAVIDGKPPAVPVLQPLIERKKNQNGPIIPAVPLNMQRRRPSIDSTAWPIIKKCDIK